KPGCRTEILWRIEHRRNRRSIEGFTRDGGKGLEISESLAPAGVEREEMTWGLNSGVESKICFTASWNWTRAAAPNSWKNPVQVTTHFDAKWSRSSLIRKKLNISLSHPRWKLWAKWSRASQVQRTAEGN